jgi:hypothetical protein
VANPVILPSHNLTYVDVVARSGTGGGGPRH